MFLKINFQVIGLARLTRQHFQRGDQPQVLQIDRTQGTRQAAKILNGLFGKSLKFIQRLVTALSLDRSLSELNALFQSNHRLKGVIVQFARQAVSLLLLGESDRADIAAQSFLCGLHLARHFG